MPANLTPQYHKAEARYRAAASPGEELSALEEMLQLIPKHKGTDRLQADLKKKIAEARVEAATPKTATGGRSVKIPKAGAARIMIIGPPNSGKSSLLCAISRAQSEVAIYPFTTQTFIPGIAHYENCPFQVIDTPPITADVMDIELPNLIRGADLVWLVADAASDEIVEDLSAVLDRFHSGKTQLSTDSYLDEEDIGKSHTRTFLVLNKIDADGAAERAEILEEMLPLPFEKFSVSCTVPQGIDRLLQRTFEALGIIRVYAKSPNEKEADRSKPFTIRQGETLVEVAEQIHRDLAASFKSAKVWGKLVHPGTMVKRDYEPADEDVVEIQ